MSVNSAHAGKGVLIYAGETIILFCEKVSIEFGGAMPIEMRGTKTGRLYLTSHRMIFNNSNQNDKLQSFDTPFFCLKKVELEQPVFGANYIKGLVKAQENGGFYGETKFKLTFKHGGAIEYGQALLKVASLATQSLNQTWMNTPPPYSAPSAPWAAAPPPAYTPPQAGYYGWVPPTNTFPDRPPTDGVFMYEAPPPYPGIGGQNSNGAALGFVPPSNPKAQEASQNSYYDPNNPQYAYVPPPPPYSANAPPYDDASKKTQ